MSAARSSSKSPRWPPTRCSPDSFRGRLFPNCVTICQKRRSPLRGAQEPTTTTARSRSLGREPLGTQLERSKEGVGQRRGDQFLVSIHLDVEDVRLSDDNPAAAQPSTEIRVVRMLDFVFDV